MISCASGYHLGDLGLKLSLSLPVLLAISMAACPLLTTTPCPAETLIAAAPEASAGDGAELINEMADSAAKWNDYSCLAELHSFKTGKDVPSTCKFFYKKKDQTRIEVTGGGFRDGSVLVRKADSSVRARGGGLLGAMTMNLDPESRMLIMANGLNVTKSDIPHLLTDWKTLLRNSYTSKIVPGSLDAAPPGTKVITVDIFDPSQALSRRLYINADQKTPIRADFFKDGKPLTECWFKNLKTNVGISDDMFKL